jgi:hypothetical protein
MLIFVHQSEALTLVHENIINSCDVLNSARLYAYLLFNLSVNKEPVAALQSYICPVIIISDNPDTQPLLPCPSSSLCNSSSFSLHLHQSFFSHFSFHSATTTIPTPTKYIDSLSTTVSDSVPSSVLGPTTPSPASECVVPRNKRGGGDTRLR